MDLNLIVSERNEARKRFLEYRRAVRARLDAEDEQIMRGYRALARGQQLLHLTKTLVAGGTDTVTWTPRGQSAPVSVTVPKLAITRADARLAYTAGIDSEGACTITADRPNGDLSPNNRKDRTRIAASTFAPVERNGWWGTLRAIVPTVPPALRPHHHLRGYQILWEATWAPHPEPPGDPALLKHIGGDLYAVVAIWDLTPLEQAVLSARADG